MFRWVRSSVAFLRSCGIGRQIHSLEMRLAEDRIGLAASGAALISTYHVGLYKRNSNAAFGIFVWSYSISSQDQQRYDSYQIAASRHSRLVPLPPANCDIRAFVCASPNFHVSSSTVLYINPGNICTMLSEHYVRRPFVRVFSKQVMRSRRFVIAWRRGGIRLGDD